MVKAIGEGKKRGTKRKEKNAIDGTKLQVEGPEEIPSVERELGKPSSQRSKRARDSLVPVLHEPISEINEEAVAGAGEEAVAGAGEEEATGSLLRRTADEESDGFMPLEIQEEEAMQATSKAIRSSKKGSITKKTNLKIDPTTPNVIYVGHIPHGFYEDEMAGFFGQFGTVSRLRLSRNKLTGKSKHYAFVEFESPEVAAIVAECMHNYLLFGCVLQVKLVAPEKIHPKLWVGANKKFRVIEWQKIAREEHNKDRSVDEQKRLLSRLLRSERKRRSKLEAAGIDYDFEGYKGHIQAPAKHVKFD